MPGIKMSHVGQRQNGAAKGAGDTEKAYNIIPMHNPLAKHPALRFPEVRASMAALRTVGELRKPPGFGQWDEAHDLVDWLGFFFGFQRDNVRNQREHLVLLLSNAQMRIDNIDALDPKVARSIRSKLLKNYTAWCSYLGRKSNVSIPPAGSASDQCLRRDLLYTALYLLIWGEAANLRFVPECLAYIFHHMAMELNRILDGYIDEATGQPAIPAITGEDAFLNRVVKPIYATVKAEFEWSRNGTAPHSAWRNYDDINEYFWSGHCFEQLKWPLELSNDFFAVPPDRNRVRKTGFVEQRSFWNLFRSFYRLWVMLIMYLQLAIIVAWEEKAAYHPAWQSLLQSRDVKVRALAIFITWAGLRFVQSVLDAATQYSLVRWETMWLGVRMVLKSIVAAAWTVVFGILYARAWDQKNRDRGWSTVANQSLLNYLEAAGMFVLPEVIALVLFILPCIRNFLDKANWRILHALAWWFQSRTFVGRGLREGLVDNVKYALFWLLLLAVKFTFSYFLQIKPMVSQSKSIYSLHDQLIHRTNRTFAIFLLWLPVVLVYLMDISIWYSIFSSLVGALVGLFSHIGEIRNVRQLRLRFQFFASAIQFNLMPEEQLLHDSKFKDAVLRHKLRYGLEQPYKKFESDQVATTKFALMWNEIVATFREEDIISDRELELLELPANSWNIRVIRWPCLLLCNELLLALNQAKERVASDREHWRKICKNEYWRCAIVEAYDSIKYLLPRIIKEGSEEHGIVSMLFNEFDLAILNEKLTSEYTMTNLPDLHAKLIALLDQLLKPEKDLNKIVNAFQTLYDYAIRDFPTTRRNRAQLEQAGVLVPLRSTASDLLFENVINLPNAEDANFYRQVRRLHTILTSRDSMNDVPKNLEARRRLSFFGNSLFMNMPRAPKVEKMLAFSVLTPYYNEDVLFSKEHLRTENEDGISILFYLQTIYDDEWANFLERMRRESGMDDQERPDIWGEKLERHLRLWASNRGQTLSRTVRGMMYYYKALKMLTFLDSVSEVDHREEGSQELSLFGSSRETAGVDGFGESIIRSVSARNLSRESSGVSLLFKGHEYGMALMKYTYVVACQLYCQQKAKKDPHYEEILELMKNNEALRVAYVDEVHTAERPEEVDYYSVLVKYDQQLQKEVEIYRVRLPGPLKLGEGKPENQNHALIFTRGDAVQTIDMNQDNYFEEALKMRNLLQEYTDDHYGARKPTILGVREHVFTGFVSSLAWFMSAQETSFVTLGQRVLANPLKVRMHYGHPDVFDRLWFLGRGGISKASRVINISEDIFAGFNCTLRGGSVTHHEYIQVGKGRDVGLNQISMFEAKVASGNGEQALSRDVYRLGHRLDFFRMLSFYYTTVGFYFNTMLVVLTVYAFVWGRLYLALSGLEAAIKGSADFTSNTALATVLNQQFIVQLGIFTALPMVVNNSLEHGFIRAVWDFLIMQLQLASVFYTFSMGTKTHYFGRTILHGGAKYRATGRGFVVQHKTFCENYRLYARSHFIKAIELGVMLTLYASYSAIAKNIIVYIMMTISSWFLVVSWIMAPFVFNPSGFDWSKTVADFKEFRKWIWCPGEICEKPDQSSWEKWWEEEQDHLRTTGLLGNLLEIVLNLRFFFFQYGIVYQLNIASNSKSIIVYFLSWIYVLLAFGVLFLIGYARDKYAAKKHIYYRTVHTLAILVIVILLKFTGFGIIDIFASLLALITTGWGMILIAQVMKPLIKNTVVWDAVVAAARLYDMMLGIIVMAPVALLSWLPGFQAMQMRILFNEPFRKGHRISRIIGLIDQPNQFSTWDGPVGAPHLDQTSKQKGKEYVELKEAPSQNTATEGSSEQPSNFDISYEAVGGRKNGRVYGLRAEGAAYEASSSRSYDQSTQPDEMKEMFRQRKQVWIDEDAAQRNAKMAPSRAQVARLQQEQEKGKDPALQERDYEDIDRD